MDLKHLRAAVAVADHLHFGHAAAVLGVAQPPLSQQVKALETELGVTLFERTTRAVVLTPAGETFVADSRAALSMVDSAARRARAVGRCTTRSRRCAAAAGFTPDIVREAVRPRPEVVFLPVSPVVRLVDLAIALPRARRSVAAANFTALARDLAR